MTATLATEPAPLAPYAQRPDEPLDAWILFLRYAFGARPRPLIENDAVRLLALRWDWETRIALLDRKLNPVRPLAEVTREIAIDSVQILSSELAAMAAESAVRPGRQRLRDLVPLLQLLTAMGGLDAARLPENEKLTYDYSLLDIEELEQLQRILAKASVRQ
jgi:hypothetical protein